MKKVIFLFFLFCFSTEAMFAEMFFAKIMDEKTKMPISSAILKFKELKKVYYSNYQGNVFIKNLPKGNYKIEILRMGYKRKEIILNFPQVNNLDIYLTPKPEKLRKFIISQAWIREETTPVSFENKSENEIEERNFGEDPNLLVSDITNVYSYTESGSGLGYSHIKVRGFDEKRIGIMINGIPLNDPEDHQVYWVDVPDIGENLQAIQFQRGVGNNVYGISTFGGSLNLETRKFDYRNRTKLSFFYGSYNTRKISLGFTKKLSNKLSISSNFSYLYSDGYRIHSKTDMKSAFFSLSYLGKKSAIDVNLYGGKELTDAAWYASPEDSLKNNHKYNPKTYPGEIDDFYQPHFEIHHSYLLNNRIKLNNSIFYVFGNGFYKQLKKDRDPWEYGLIKNHNDTLTVDLVRKKNVTKNQVGWISNTSIEHKNGKLLIGSYLSKFNSKHWGKVDSVSIDTLNSNVKYYEYHGNKAYYSFYAREQYNVGDKLNLNLNVLNMNINYHFKQLQAGNFFGAYLNRYEVNYHFINPSLGISFIPSEVSTFYFNIANKSREPADNELYDLWEGPDDIGVQPLFSKCDTIRDDEGNIKYLKWEKPYIKEENLIDFEFGTRLKFGLLNLNMNLFYMFFKNEIVPYGGADDEGNPIRGNADRTIHRGIELSFDSILPYNFYLKGNFSYNDNYYKKFIMHTWDQNWNLITKDYSNKKIAGYPSIIAKCEINYKIKNFSVKQELNYFGKQYLDNENLESRIVKPYFLLNSQVNYFVEQYKGIDRIGINIKFNNVLNRKYETSGYYDSWDDKNYYWPGAEFNVIGGLTIEF